MWLRIGCVSFWGQGLPILTLCMPGPVLELGDTASCKAQSELAGRSGGRSRDSGYNSKILSAMLQAGAVG